MGEKPVQRTSKGQFAKGQSGNPGGKVGIPEDVKRYGRQAPGRMRKLADDPGTPVKVKADIEKWFAEMAFGKPRQAVDVDGNLEGNQTVRFEGALEEWSK